MLIKKKLPSLSCPTFTSSIVKLILLGLIVLPFAGCGADGGGDAPIISSLSEPVDEPQLEDLPDTDLPPPDVDEVAPLLAESNPASAGDEEDPTISVASTPTSSTAQLNWDASLDPNVTGYYVYYGKESPGIPGSCSYEETQTVEAPPATISGLEPNTQYFFAISAYGEESESPCSNELRVSTPPAQG